jgi:hypothetical protein
MRFGACDLLDIFRLYVYREQLYRV